MATTKDNINWKESNNWEKQPHFKNKPMKNPLTPYIKQLNLVKKYQEWAHENGLYSSYHLDSTQYGKWKNERTGEYEEGSIKFTIMFHCQPKSYTNVKAFMKKFGVKKMGKDVSSYDETEMEFNTEHEGIEIKMYAVSELGPRCKVVYEDVVVPATKEVVLKATPEHTKKVAKIVCK